MTDNTNNNIEKSKSTIDKIIDEIKAKIQHNEAIENDFLSKTYDEIKKINNLIDEKLKGLGENTEKLVDLNNNIIAQESDIAQLNEQLSEMKKKQEELEGENTNLKLSNNANKEKADEYDNINKQNEKLIEDMKIIQNEKESLEQEKTQLEEEKTKLANEMEGKVRELQEFINAKLTSIEDKDISIKMKKQIEDIIAKLSGIEESKKQEPAPEGSTKTISEEQKELDYKGKWEVIKKKNYGNLLVTLVQNGVEKLFNVKEPEFKTLIDRNEDGYLILKRNIYTINDLIITDKTYKLTHLNNKDLGFYSEYRDIHDRGWLMTKDQLDTLYNKATQNGGKKKSKYYTRKMKMVGGYRYVGNPFGSSPSPLIIEDPKKKARKSSRKSSRKSKRTLRSNKKSKAKLSKGGKRKQRKTRKQKK